MSHKRLKVALPAAEMSLFGGQSVGIYNVALGLVKGLSLVDVDLYVIASKDFVQDCRVTKGISTEDVHFEILEAPLSGVKRLYWEMHGVVRWAEKVEADWLVLPKGFAPYTRSNKLKMASYVHDLILDFYKSRYSWYLSFVQKNYFPRLLKNTLSKSDLLLTNSDFTTEQLGEKYGVKARTLGIGFDDIEVHDKCQKCDYDFLIYHSPAPHKLGEQVVEQMEALESHLEQELKICCIGGKHSRWDVFSKMSEEEYRDLLNRVNIVVYASEYEGFGMPPVERLLVNKGVIASNIQPMNDHVSSELLFKNNDQQDFIRVASDALLHEEWTPFLKTDVKSWGQIAENLRQMLLHEGGVES